MPRATNIGQHALVIGASLAGLAAARVLADHFAEVTLLERDVSQVTLRPRHGVPQGSHTHLLNLRGQQSLTGLFPGLEAQLDQAGAPKIRWMSDTRIYIGGGWLKRDDLDLTTRALTRPRLEQIVRGELVRQPNVRFVEHSQVTGLLLDAAQARVTGLSVSYRPSGFGPDDQPETLTADLIVDASGRHSRLPEWLQALGLAAPAESRVTPWFGYATRMYSRLSFEPDWKLLVNNQSAPRQPRMTAIAQQEDGQWIATLGGYGRRHQPPGDPDGFLAFAQSLPTPDVFEALRSATPITEISRYGDTANVWRHYEALTRFPAGLIVVGDALCSFNPVYGQGMTAAALAADALGDCLDRAGAVDTVGQSFQRQMARVLIGPWQWATGGDLQFPETEGQRPGGIGRLAPHYVNRLLEAMHDDVALVDALMRVLGMLKPAQSLFGPPVLMKVLAQSARQTARTFRSGG